MTQAYPLQWPIGWPRATTRTRAKFGRNEHKPSQHGGGWMEKKSLSVSDGTGRVLAELERVGARGGSVIVSTNLQLRLDNLPRSGQAEPNDPGVAVYWKSRAGKDRVMAVDRYDRVADNLAALAATLEAMRAIERHGGAQVMEKAFTGFDALPAPRSPWQTLGLSPEKSPSADDIRAAYRARAMKAHPDQGGSESAMAELNWARDEALKLAGGAL